MKIVADVVLVGIGRRANTDGLGLDKVGLKTDKQGRVSVDKSFKTNIPSIRAIGDVISGPMLAHKAEEEAIAVVSIIKGKMPHLDYFSIPSVIYTHPEVAWCGNSEDDLKAKGIEFNTGVFPFAANSRARANRNDLFYF